MRTPIFILLVSFTAASYAQTGTKVISADTKPSDERKNLEKKKEQLKGEIAMFELQFNSKFPSKFHYSGEPTELDLKQVEERIIYIRNSRILELYDQLDNVQFEIDGEFPEVLSGRHWKNDLAVMEEQVVVFRELIAQKAEIAHLKNLEAQLTHEEKDTDILAVNSSGEYELEAKELNELEERYGEHDTNFVIRMEDKMSWVEDKKGNVVFPKFKCIIHSYRDGVARVEYSVSKFKPCNHVVGVKCGSVLDDKYSTEAYKTGYMKGDRNFINGVYEVSFIGNYQGAYLVAVPYYNSEEERIAAEQQQAQRAIERERLEQKLIPIYKNWKNGIR